MNFGKLPHYSQFLPHAKQTRFFRPKVKFAIEKGKYLIKTADSAEELNEVLRLRYEIFHREYRNRMMPVGLDFEPLDLIADHLTVLDKSQGKIVGTYRLLSSAFSGTFYSASEFQIKPLLALPGTKLELSRAGIRRDFRNGQVINLLWRGVSHYLKEVGAKYLFGCASVWTTDATVVRGIQQKLEDADHTLQNLKITPTADYTFPNLSNAALGSSTSDLPALFQSYLRMGAKVAAVPALDREFRCVDFFTLLNIEDLNRLYERKYRPC